MVPAQHKIQVNRTAHYATLGEPGHHIKRFIFACHGYGQVAEKFILDLAPLADEHTFIVAPEGLSTFYWGGFEGPTVSSWMTRRHRLDEIEDYSKYLSQLFHLCLSQCTTSPDQHHSSPPPHSILMGFSQGCATIMRWVMKAFPEPAHHLLFWAGGIPEDLDYRPHMDYFKQRKLTLALGNQDPFFSKKTLTWHQNMLKEKQLPIEEIQFEGKHEIPEQALTRILSYEC